MPNINIALLGATGAVGEEFINLLEDVNMYTGLFLFSSKKSAGKRIRIGCEKYVVQELTANSLTLISNELSENDLNIAILCLSTDLSKYYVENVFSTFGSKWKIIDNSSEFRLKKDVPLIIPEINRNLITEFKPNLIASPNCSTAILLTALYPIHVRNNIKSIIVTTFQAVSGAGKNGMNELALQTAHYYGGTDCKWDEDAEICSVPIINTFNEQIAFNCFSHDTPINPETYFNGEEEKMVLETQKILNSNIVIFPTCVRVPTMRSHLESVNVTFENDTSVEEIYSILKTEPSIEICDDIKNNSFPTPLKSTKKKEILVGRVRPGYNSDDKKNYSMLISGDQLLKGAAWNMFQIMEELIKVYNATNSKKRKLEQSCTE